MKEGNARMDHWDKGGMVTDRSRYGTVVLIDC